MNAEDIKRKLTEHHKATRAKLENDIKQHIKPFSEDDPQNASEKKCITNLITPHELETMPREFLEECAEKINQKLEAHHNHTTLGIPPP